MAVDEDGYCEHKVCTYCKAENETVKLVTVGSSAGLGNLFRYLCSKCRDKNKGWVTKPNN